MGDEVLYKTNREKDLGAEITPNLSPEAHIKIIPSAAYARLANIRTTFRNMCKESFITLRTTHVRPILEYVAPAWSPYLIEHKTKIEKVQRYATRQVLVLRGMSYKERLRELHLTSLEDRNSQEDMITTHKTLRGIDG
ncbi:uncharacterized protein [Procambarus clarkii]|uniref:uncharacterized protein n=1 Tax=Procambarus clarkii TaxID=6728 RepID=UPI0037449A0C